MTKPKRTLEDKARNMNRLYKAWREWCDAERAKGNLYSDHKTPLYKQQAQAVRDFWRAAKRFK